MGEAPWKKWHFSCISMDQLHIFVTFCSIMNATRSAHLWPRCSKPSASTGRTNREGRSVQSGDREGLCSVLRPSYIISGKPGNPVLWYEKPSLFFLLCESLSVFLLIPYLLSWLHFFFFFWWAFLTVANPNTTPNNKYWNKDGDATVLLGAGNPSFHTSFTTILGSNSTKPGRI